MMKLKEIQALHSNYNLRLAVWTSQRRTESSSRGSWTVRMAGYHVNDLDIMELKEKTNIPAFRLNFRLYLSMQTSQRRMEISGGVAWTTTTMGCLVNDLDIADLKENRKIAALCLNCRLRLAAKKDGEW